MFKLRWLTACVLIVGKKKLDLCDVDRHSGDDVDWGRIDMVSWTGEPNKNEQHTDI